MTSASDGDQSRGDRDAGTELKRRRYHPSKFVSIYVEKDSEGLLYSAVIDQNELNRIARLGDIPQHRIKLFEERLRAVLCSLAGHDARHRFTRRQLLNELSKLESLPDDAAIPPIPEWVWTEIGNAEYRRLLEAEIGPLPWRADSEEHAIEYSKATMGAHSSMIQRWQKSRKDPAELRALAFDAHAAVSARSEYTREYYATKRALAPERSHIAENIFGFWTEVLGRPRKITKAMIAFTDAVYRLYGIEMKPDAVKGQLNEARKRQKSQ